eukprot:gene9070-11109_t
MTKLVECKLKGHRDSVTFVTSRDKVLASSSSDSTVRLWDTDTNKSIRCIKGFGTDSVVNSICFDENAQSIYCAHENKISVFDLRQPSIVLTEIVHQYQYNLEEINQIGFDSKYQYLGSCDDSGQIKIIDVQKKKLYETLAKKHTNICSSMVFRPNSKNELLSGSMDFSVIHWDFLKCKVLHRENFKDVKTSQSTTESKNQTLNPPFVNSIDISNNGKYVSIGTGDGQILVNEISSFKQYVSIPQAHSSSISLVHYPKYENNDNSKSLFSCGGYDSKIYLWDISEETNQKALAIQDQDESKNSRVKLWTQHHSKINWITTSSLSQNLYIADITNDITLLSIVD